MVLLQAAGTGGNGWATLIMFGGMFVIMYFFMIRPQQKKQKEAKLFQDALAVGDRVMTLGGIHGKVVEVGDTFIVMSIDQGRMRVEKAGISPTKQVETEVK
jgi:preprotein translocase subunit YajC